MMYYRSADVGASVRGPGVDSAGRTVTALVAGRELVLQDGLRIVAWDLAWFERNPVVLFAHDRGQLPVATGQALVTRQGLLGVTTFPAAGRYCRSDEIFDAYEDGRLRSFSVGFEVLERMPEEGPEAVRARLREWSCVPLGADPQAVLPAPLADTGGPGWTGRQLVQRALAQLRLDRAHNQLKAELNGRAHVGPARG